MEGRAPGSGAGGGGAAASAIASVSADVGVAVGVGVGVGIEVGAGKKTQVRVYRGGDSNSGGVCRVGGGSISRSTNESLEGESVR